MKRLVVLLVLLLLILHQDFWWWDDIDPLAFGFLPIGLSFHVLLSILTSGVYLLAVRYCWPRDLETNEAEPNREQRSRAEL